MKNILVIIQKLFLYLILVIIGLYAGMLFNHKLCPVETQLSPIEYAKYWKIVDGTFMHERMAIIGPGMGIVFAITILQMPEVFLKNKTLIIVGCAVRMSATSHPL